MINDFCFVYSNSNVPLKNLVQNEAAKKKKNVKEKANTNRVTSGERTDQ